MGIFSVSESDEYCALEEENKRLKKQVESLKKELYFLLEKNNKLSNEELQNELLILRKEKELLKNNLKLSEELRQYSSENKILELRGEIKYLKEKNSSLENELAIQIELNTNLCRHIIEINEK